MKLMMTSTALIGAFFAPPATAYRTSAWAGLGSGNQVSGPCDVAKKLAIAGAKKACLNADQVLADDCEDRVLVNSSSQPSPGMSQTIREEFPVKYVTVTYRCGR